ncbi:MAG: hypothetical protein R3C45_16330 [Phycisphaerales bacterium]
MPRTRIKICGIREPDHARCAIEAGADYVGLNFIEGSPRRVEIADARTLVAAICAASTTVEPVALFANQSRGGDRGGAGTRRLQDYPTAWR